MDKFRVRHLVWWNEGWNKESSGVGKGWVNVAGADPEDEALRTPSDHPLRGSDLLISLLLHTPISKFKSNSTSSPYKWMLLQSPWDFPDGPVVKTPRTQRRGLRFDLWSGN